MDELIIKLLYDILIILATIVAGFLVELIRQRIGVEGMKKIEQELTAKQELAMLAVRFVQQAYRDLGGPEKYNKAAEWLVDMAAKQGLNLSADEVKGLIEAALRAFKDEFGNDWGKQTK